MSIICPICQERVQDDNICKLNLCKHRACRTCMRTYTEHSFREKLRVFECFISVCQFEYDPAPFMDDGMLKDWRGWKASRGRCPTCNTMIARGMCVYCDCEHCKAKKHTGSCKRGDRKSVSTLETQTQPCPGCGAHTQRSGGCAHMACAQCQHRWNWNSRDRRGLGQWVVQATGPYLGRLFLVVIAGALAAITVAVRTVRRERVVMRERVQPYIERLQAHRWFILGRRVSLVVMFLMVVEGVMTEDTATCARRPSLPFIGPCTAMHAIVTLGGFAGMINSMW